MTELNNFDSSDCSSQCQIQCTTELKLNTDCDSECLNIDCEFDFPYCENTFCAAGCLISQLGDGIYDAECDNSDCWFDLGDTRTVNSEVLYVNGDLDIDGTGTQNDPFGNIQEALKQVRYKTTEIYLLNNLHYLKLDSKDSLSSISKRSYTEVIIQPKYCEEGETDCVEIGTKPVVYLLNALVRFDVYARVYVKNVRFEQDYFFVDCSECEYCRYVEFVDGIAYSDQEIELNEGEFVDSSECENFYEYSVFNVYGDGELQLEVKVI